VRGGGRAVASILVAAAIGVPTACRARRHEPGPSLRKVRVAYLPFLSYAPVLIGAAEGCFREQGLEVELVNVPSTDSVAALVRGDVDAATSFLYTGFFNAIARGGRIRIVADKGHAEPGACASDGLIARSGLEPTEKADWLRGRSLAFRPSSIEEFWIERYLSSAGLSWNDVVIKAIPASAKLDALASGAIDAAAWSEPSITLARQRGVASLAASVASTVANLQWAYLAFGRRLLDEDREAGRRLVVAYLKSVRQYNRGKTDRNVAILADATGVSADVVRESCWISIHDDGTIDVGSVVEFESWAKGRGLLDEVLPPESFWEPAFIEAAVPSLSEQAGR